RRSSDLDAFDVGAAAELAFGADFARHPGDLVGEGGQLVDHGVDGVFELEHLALDVHGDLFGEVAAGHRRRHLGDVPHLVGEVVGHGVDVVGEVFPDAGDAFDVGAAAEFAFGADFARHPGDLVGEGRQLVDHGVDGVFELEHFALDVHGDLFGEVAAGHRRRHLGDVPHLVGEVVGHGVDVV